jgi:hypothetical protein
MCEEESEDEKLGKRDVDEEGTFCCLLPCQSELAEMEAIPVAFISVLAGRTETEARQAAPDRSGCMAVARVAKQRQANPLPTRLLAVVQDIVPSHPDSVLAVSHNSKAFGWCLSIGCDSAQ